MNLINNSLLAYYIRRARIWTPAAIFAQGQQGVWYEPKPKYLYQDAAGTTPVTADGDPVGLMLDLSRGLVKGPELVTNGTFDTDLTGWSIPSFSTGRGSISRVNGRLQVDNTTGTGDCYVSTSFAPQSINAAEIQLNVDDSQDIKFYWKVGTDFFGQDAGTTSFFITGGVGDRRRIILENIPEGVDGIAIGSQNTSGVWSIDNISVRELPGNHASQATSAARPLYRTNGTLHWLAFDGVDDFLSTGQNTGISGDFSLSAFVKYSSAYSGSNFPAVFSQNPGASGTGMAMTIRNNRPAMDVWDHRVTIPSSLDQTPHLVGLLKSPGPIYGTTTIRVDKSENATALDGSNITPNLGDNILQLGRLEDNASRFFPGNMYSVILVDEVVSDATIAMIEDYLD